MIGHFLRGATLAFALSGAALAQTAEVGFGAGTADPDAPVEVTSETLAVDQNDGTALFIGNVIVGQGEMRLTAPKVRVIYNQDQSAVERMVATGGVTLVSGPDAAEARNADYTISTGVVVMTGDVLMTQGASAISAEKMTVRLKDGTAQMSGRVKTILKSADE